MRTIKKLLFRMKKENAYFINISTDEVIFIGDYHCNGVLTLPTINTVAYYNGVNIPPILGDNIYTDLEMTISYPNGHYLTDYGIIFISSGVITYPGDCL